MPLRRPDVDVRVLKAFKGNLSYIKCILRHNSNSLLPCRTPKGNQNKSTMIVYLTILTYCSYLLVEGKIYSACTCGPAVLNKVHLKAVSWHSGGERVKGLGVEQLFCWPGCWSWKGLFCFLLRNLCQYWLLMWEWIQWWTCKPVLKYGCWYWAFSAGGGAI